MKTKQFTFLLCAALLSFSSCKKDDSTSGDLTTDVVGHYTNSSDNTDIVVNKIDDSSISITMSTGSGSGSYNMAWPKATMTSKTAFTMEEVEGNTGCQGTEKFSGTGTASNGNISLFITIKGTGLNTPYDCYDWNDNVSASK